MRTSTPTLRFTVFGHPVGHSLSPRIHRAFARQLGLDLTYDTTDASAEDFADAVHAFFAAGGSGANITVPHKRAAFDLADERDDNTTRIGAANVLTRRDDGSIAAANTDGDGLIRDLTQRHHVPLAKQNVALLGAGGAAQGVAFALLDAGIAHLTIINRTAARAQVLSERLHAPDRVSWIGWDDIGALAPTHIIIDATSAGVTGTAFELPDRLITPDCTCYALAYGKPAQRFVAWAQATGASRALDGLGMLLEQAADSLAIWTGQRPETEPVYQQLRAAIDHD